MSSVASVVWEAELAAVYDDVYAGEADAVGGHSIAGHRGEEAP